MAQIPECVYLQDTGAALLLSVFCTLLHVCSIVYFSVLLNLLYTVRDEPFDIQGGRYFFENMVCFLTEAKTNKILSIKLKKVCTLFRKIFATHVSRMKRMKTSGNFLTNNRLNKTKKTCREQESQLQLQPDIKCSIPNNTDTILVGYIARASK